MDRKSSALVGLVLCLVLSPTLQTPVGFTTPQPAENKTLVDIINRQADAVKTIVSHHQINYPVYADPKSKPETLEELKIKCQHLSRLITPAPHPQNKTGFYITTEATTSKPTTTPQPTKQGQNVKYIKLEPVILQKTIMSDGRTIYYWHKSLPSHISVGPTSTTTPPQSTTLSGYNFRNFFPFYSVGGSEPSTTSTTEKATAPTEPPEEHVYQHQLKFVVPVPFAAHAAPPDEQTVKKPYEFDQFAYYPKQLQPETVNMEMPYVPTFHIIKAIAVPNDAE